MTLEEAIEIAQNQDATAHKVGNIRPEFKGEPLQMEVHKLQGNRQSRASRKRQQPQRPASNDQKQGRSKRETCFYCGAKPSHPKSECPGKREKCFKCGKEGHYGSVFKSKSKDARVNELHVQSTTVSECVDCVLNEYEPVYFNAPTHHLNTVTVESLIQNQNLTSARYGSARNLHHKSSRLTARLIPEQVVTFCRFTRLKHSSETT